MKRIISILSIASLSSVFVMQGACTISGDGISIIPTLPSLGDLIAELQTLTGL